MSEILLSFKDKNNNPVKFTLNRVEANPDFNEIKKNSFEKYFYKNSRQTYLEDYDNSEKVYNLINKGIMENFFQFNFMREIT